MDTRFEPLVAALVDGARQLLGDRLVAIVVYGSVARGDTHDGSDVDLIVVADGWPEGMLDRCSAFRPVVDAALLGPAAALLRSQGQRVEISPQLWGRPSLAAFSFLHLDLATDGVVCFDPHGVFARRMAEVRATMARLGTRKELIAGTWCWDLKPDFRPGEVFEL